MWGGPAAARLGPPAERGWVPRRVSFRWRFAHTRGSPPTRMVGPEPRDSGIDNWATVGVCAHRFGVVRWGAGGGGGCGGGRLRRGLAHRPSGGGFRGA